MTPDEALNMMKGNPNSAFRDCRYSVALSRDFARQPVNPLTAMVGYRAALSPERLERSEKDMFQLTITGRGQDCYYFPYVTTSPGVGFCFVPKDEAPGTVVLTGGMNGCALQINETADHRNLIFMHDKDSEAINAANIPAIVGQINQAYRQTADFRTSHQDAIDPNTPNNILHSRLRITDANYIDMNPDIPLKGKTIIYYAYYLITVKMPGIWAVYSSCVVTLEDRSIVRGNRTGTPPYLLGHIVTG